VIAALAPRAFAVFERNVRVYRRQWLMIVTGFFEPLFFLLGIGFGVGGVIGPNALAHALILVAWIIGGTVVASILFRRRMLK